MYLIIIVLVIICLLIYIRFVGTHGFIVKEYAIKSEKLPSSFNGLKIVHLSDIHFATVGKNNMLKVVDEINIIKPDIVVFTGDLYDEFSIVTDDVKNDMIEVLSKINSNLGKYAVSGNHDYSADIYEEILSKSNFTYLNNESKLIYYKGDTPIELIGFPSYLKGEVNYDIELSDNYKIALIHEGDAIENIKDKNIDLVLAGHSHGGQVRFPFIGAFKPLLPDGAKKYYDEYYKVNNSDLYISSGLGESQFILRWFNKRSFNLYRLYTK